MSEQVTPVQERTKPKGKSSEPTPKLAASWYIAMRSSDLEKKPLELKLFGQPLVAWRDQVGRPVIMERHCAHLGASLALGKVVDGCIQCPFHLFRFDSTGKCVHIPGNGTSVPALEHMPPAAHQVTYVTAERYGYVWIWYGSQVPMFPLPEFPYAERDKSSYRFLAFALPTNTTVLRVLENAFDPQHLACIHTTPISSITLTALDDWHQWPEHGAEELAQTGAWFGASLDAQVSAFAGKIGMLASKVGLNVNKVGVRYSGFPGGLVVTILINGEVIYKTLTGITPADDNELVWHGLIAIKKSGKISTDLINYIVFGVQSRLAAGQDVAIWNTMKSDGGRFFTRYDQVMLKFRAFYRSWVDKVDPEYSKYRLPVVVS